MDFKEPDNSDLITKNKTSEERMHLPSHDANNYQSSGNQFSVVKSYYTIPQFIEDVNAAPFRYFEVEVQSNPKKKAEIFVGLVPDSVTVPDTITDFSELQD